MLHRARRAATSLVAALALGALALVPISAPAQAATPASQVKINKIGNKSVAKKSAKAKIAPSVSVGKNVKVTSKVVTVKKGSKTVAKNKASYAAAPGTYKVTTTVKYKTKSTKKVVVTNGASNTKRIPMRCTVVSTETMYDVEGLDVEFFSMKCTGKDFDGVYKANAAFVYPNELSEFLGVDMLWGESFPSEPYFFPYVGKTFSISAVPKDGKLYKTVTSWSATKTVAKTQTVKVSVRKR